MKQFEKQDRKKFLGLGAALLGILSLPPLFRRIAKQSTVAENKKIKMLTRDGRLVEVDEKLIASASYKVSNNELKNWIEKDKK